MTITTRDVTNSGVLSRRKKERKTPTGMRKRETNQTTEGMLRESFASSSSSSSSLQFRSCLSFTISIFLRFPTGYSDGAPGAKNGTNATSQGKSSGGSGSMVLIILFGIAAVVLLSFLLYKFWQKKKRAEQYARLLKLFEEDDELEVELGLRD